MSTQVRVLGIESTAHTFGVGIAINNDPYIVVNEKITYIPREGGIHPREASRYLAANASKVLSRALKRANLTLSQDIDAIAVSLGPGMGPSLRVGATVARALAYYYSKPLVPVNHAVAHIEIGILTTGAKDPIVVYLSGGNTAIIAYLNRRYRIFGETLDMALGNVLDTFARETGLGPPFIVNGMHVVDSCGNKGKRFLELPYIVKGQDLSFAGLLTQALKLWKEGFDLNDICLTFREIAYSMVTEVAERAIAHTRKKEILLVGGVASSGILKDKMSRMARIHDIEVYVVPPEYATDNGAMIAWTGLLAYRMGITIPIDRSFIKPRWRVDEVEIAWRN